jgi:hypothetical protein
VVLRNEQCDMVVTALLPHHPLPKVPRHRSIPRSTRGPYWLVPPQYTRAHIGGDSSRCGHLGGRHRSARELQSWRGDVARGRRRGHRRLASWQRSVPISTPESRSNTQPGGERYFIYRPPPKGK